MKTGAIHYVAGDKPAKAPKADPKELIEKSGIRADRLEVIAHDSGHFDIHDAWWHLTARGMQLILCIMAEIDPNGEMRLTGRQMRLCG